ncbi:mask, partial [Symbiodinium sp. KB8]
MKAAMAEFVGTMLLVFIGCGAASLNGADTPEKKLVIALCFGIGVTVLAYATGHHSGGQLNCAVTFSLCLGRAISWQQLQVHSRSWTGLRTAECPKHMLRGVNRIGFHNESVQSPDINTQMLHVWKASGRELAAVRLEELSDVRALKRYLQGLCGVPRFRQMLLYDGRSLEDDLRLDMPLDLHLVLLSFPCDITTEARDQLVIAAGDGSVSQVEEMLRKPQDANWANAFGQTPLVVAADLGHLEVAALLLEAKADPDLLGSAEGDGEQQTPLYLASTEGHLEIVHLLLEANADHGILSGSHERTALYQASWHGHLEVARALLDFGAAVNQKDGCCHTALQAAAIRGYGRMARLLLDAGANADVEGSLGDSPLLHAAQEGHVEVVRLLLQELDGEHLSSRHLDVVRSLLKSGAGQRPEIARLLVGVLDAVSLAPKAGGALNFVAQSFGAVMGAVLLAIMIPCDKDLTTTLASNMAAPGFSNGHVLLAEACGTFMLCFTVWETAVSPISSCGKNACIA